MAMAELCNGERAVVVLFLVRVLYSVPDSLAYEATALVILAVAGLAVELAAEGGPQAAAALARFRIRPGASSGILLGTITPPTVMLSRLIQMSRVLSNQDVAPEELGYLSIPYWSVSASCFGVLAFFYWVLQRPSNNTRSFRFWSFDASERISAFIIFNLLVCYWSFASRTYSGWHIMLNMLWFICHGLTTVIFIQHILCAFPSCASIGEALLVSSGMVHYFGDMSASTLSKIEISLFTSKLEFVNYAARTEISTVIQGWLLALLLFAVFYNLLLRVWNPTSGNNTNSQVAEGWPDRVMMRSILFYASLSVFVTVVGPAWMKFVQDLNQHPLLWVCNFVLSEPSRRVGLCIYWMLVICLSVVWCYHESKDCTTKRILLRKWYHLVAVVMFVPALLIEPAFLDLAFGAALAVFIILEMIRVWRIWPLGNIIEKFMSAFSDHRDSEFLIISHFSLLLGCALPKWMSSGFNDRPLAPFAGILSLGIGDSMASVVGYKYGTVRWSKCNEKTIEGTLAGIISVLTACSVVYPLSSTGVMFAKDWVSLSVASILGGLLEAYTAQLDNAFIPLVFYSLLCL